MLVDGSIYDQQINTGANIALSKLANGDLIMLTTGATMTGTLNMNSQTITNLNSPVGLLDAVNKNYVDSLLQGLKFKDSVRVATTGNLTSLNGLLTIDTNVTLQIGDRILVKDQTTKTQNGIFVAATGAWSRAEDSNTWDKLVAACVYVEEGLVNQNSSWSCTVTSGGSLGSTNITWILFGRNSGGGLYIFGTGLQVIGGNIVSVSSDVTLLGNNKTGNGSTIVMSDSPILTTPNVSNYINAQHDHSSSSKGGPLNASVLLINGEAAATANDMDLEMMQMNFQYVSWAQFAVYDNFADNTKREMFEVGDATHATIAYNELTNGVYNTPNTEYVFNSKLYHNITTLVTGLGVGTSNAFVDASSPAKHWFPNEIKNLTLQDNLNATFNVNSNLDNVMTVVGTPATGAYSLYTANPTACFAFCTYKDATNGSTSKNHGYVKLEVTFDNEHYLTLLDTYNNINWLGAIMSLSYPGHEYKVRITLKNDINGLGPSVQNFLVATDPSVWRF